MKNDDEKSIELKLIDDVSISEIAKISTDISEITLDSIMEDGILKDFPFISTVVSIIKTTQNVRERIYAKKILLFLNSSNKGDSEKRIAFIQKLNKNPSEKQKVGETLMLILEKSDEMTKPSVIGNLFKAHLEDNLTYDEFIKLSSIVNRVNWKDLVSFREAILSKSNLGAESEQYLAINGLMSFGIVGQELRASTTDISPYIFYVPTKISKKLLEYGF